MVMKINHENHNQMQKLWLRGDLAGEDVNRLRKHLDLAADANIRDFVIHLDEVETIDSKGLELLLWLQDQCAETLGQMRLVAPSHDVVTILEMTRLSELFETHQDTPSALASLS